MLNSKYVFMNKKANAHTYKTAELTNKRLHVFQQQFWQVIHSECILRFGVGRQINPGLCKKKKLAFI